MGIVHRDIKPSNLLVDAHSHLWITDFGLATTQTDAGLTMTGDLLGTLRYMSPEQAAGDRARIDYRTDIYSLSITLYELLTHQPAFASNQRQQLLRQIAFDEPRPPRQIDPQIPVDLETITLKAMRKDPEQRYATARDLADDLRSFLDDKPIKAKPPTWREQLMKWSRRHPAAIWAAVLFVSATAIVSTASAILINRAYYREATQRELADARLKTETEARERADTESARAQAVSDFLLDMIFSPARGWRIKGSQYTVREMLDDYSAGLGNQLTGQPEAEAMIRHAIGCSYLMLGTPDRAEPYLKQAMELRRTHGGQQRESLPDSIAIYGKSLFLQGKYDEAEPPLREALEIYHQRGIRGAMPISARKDLLQVLAAAGRHDEAEHVIQQAWAEMQGYDELQPEFAHSSYGDAADCAGFAYYFATVGKQKEAEMFLRRAALAQQRLRKPIDSLAALQFLAIARLRLGDQAGYREACRELAVPPTRGANDDSPYIANDEFNLGRIWTCCLGPDAVDDADSLVKQAEKFAASNSLLAPYIDFNLLGAAHYRAGHLNEAAECFQKSINTYPSDPPPSHGTVLWPQLYLAMSKWQLGEHDDARRLLREIQPAIDKSLETPTHLWQYRQITEILRREAEALIHPNEANEAVENKTRTGDETKQ